MKSLHGFVTDPQEYAEIAEVLDACVKSDSRLPDQVFKRKLSFVFSEYDESLSEEFWRDLQDLAAKTREERISFGSVEPEARYFRSHFGYYGAFSLPVSTPYHVFQSRINFEPEESVADALRFSASAWVLCAGSGSWSVWAQRGLGLTVLNLDSTLTNVLTRAKISFSVEEALANMVAPNFKNAIVPDDMARRLRRAYSV